MTSELSLDFAHYIVATVQKLEMSAWTMNWFECVSVMVSGRNDSRILRSYFSIPPTANPAWVDSVEFWICIQRAPRSMDTFSNDKFDDRFPLFKYVKFERTSSSVKWGTISAQSSIHPMFQCPSNSHWAGQSCEHQNLVIQMKHTCFLKSLLVSVDVKVNKHTNVSGQLPLAQCRCRRKILEKKSVSKVCLLFTVYVFAL